MTNEQVDLERLESVLAEAERFEAPAPGIAWGEHVLRFAELRAMITELRAAREREGRLERCLLPVTMGMALAEMAGEPLADDTVVLSFSGGGGSDFITAGEVRQALAANERTK